jgi:exopolysaccharide biosynthesis WecB/TagA/CpsF family protein
MGQDVVISHELAQTPRHKAIFGVQMTDISQDAALSLLGGAVEARQPLKIAFCNAHTANLAWGDGDFRQTLTPFTVFADGVGVDMAAKLLHGAPFAANLNGTDFVPLFLRGAKRPLRIALIGGRPGVAERAALELARLAPQHHLTHIQHGFGDAASEQAFVEALKLAPVHVLLVAMGNPAQERWIARHITGDHATLAIGVGALFDFLSHEVPRAPPWMRRLRIEWLFRLLLEPRRLFLRYVLGNPLFLLRVLAVRAGLRTL